MLMWVSAFVGECKYKDEGGLRVKLNKCEKVSVRVCVRVWVCDKVLT